MSRTDQYIGLNKNAYDFINNIKEKYDYWENFFKLVPSDNTLCSPDGIDGYYIKIYFDDLVNEYGEFFEEIQYEPWSSGPMYTGVIFMRSS